MEAKNSSSNKVEGTEAVNERQMPHLEISISLLSWPIPEIAIRQFASFVAQSHEMRYLCSITYGSGLPHRLG